MEDFHVEVACNQRNYHGEHICGDVFLSKRIREENRVLSVLSDGMGHGVKASVLATLTATMTLNLTEEHHDPATIAGIIMRVLPVCSERHISYSTFTVVDVNCGGETSILEYDNPTCLILRGNRVMEPEWNCILLSNTDDSDRKKDLLMCSFIPQKEDRIIFCSDGITQSGLGNDKYLLGWGRDNYVQFVLEQVTNDKYISAVELAKRVVDRAYANDLYSLNDDASCGVIYFREPRTLMICTGPPFEESKDAEFAKILWDFKGKKIICGATTTDIIAREWKETVNDNFEPTDLSLPPISQMEGVDLITEGALTLSKVINLLRENVSPNKFGKGPADLICKMLLESDKIFFLIGTRINTMHHDPNMPIELEIRKTLIKRLAEILEEKYLKEVIMEFM